MSRCARRARRIRYAGYISACLLTAWSSVTLAQGRVTADLPDGIIRSVDRLYPGFVEVLESHDSFALAGLVETLVASGSGDAVPVLAWMLEHRPAVNPELVASALNRLSSSTGRVPVAALARTLGSGNADQRRAAAIVLFECRDAVAAADRPARERALMAALSDPSVEVRTSVAMSVIRLETPEAAAALEASLLREDVTSDYYWHATGRARPGTSTAPQTRPASVAAALDLLRDPDPDRRLAGATFFDELFSQRTPPVSASERAAAVTALIATLGDPVVRTRRVAAHALGRARARDATPALLQSLDLRDASRYYLTTAFNALQAIGDRRAVPALERWGRSPREYELRVEAVRAALSAGKPRDPAATARELLWEPPDTALEREVLARGRDALPLAWRALAEGPAPDRRAALALLGWVRDLRSIPHILSALDAEPGALSRRQLLFDLNAVLLTEAPELARRDDIDVLAAQHLERVLEDLDPAGAASRPALPGAPQKVPLPRCDRTVGVYPLAASVPPRATARAMEVAAFTSREAFDAWLKSAKERCGIAFHAVRASGGIARVTSTIIRPGGGILNQFWITLHRADGERWAAIPVPPFENRSWTLNDPNLIPAINRNYGALDPLKVVRLAQLMERIGLGYGSRDRLARENGDLSGEWRELDSSYLPLLERYRTSPSVDPRLTAELEVARITGVPDLRVLIDAFERETASPLRADVHRVLANYILAQFKSRGTPASSSERSELSRAATELTGPDAPSQLPRERDITSVKRWQAFALVEVSFGSGPRAESGYSLLFERRDGRWVFTFVTRSWIA